MQVPEKGRDVFGPTCRFSVVTRDRASPPPPHPSPGPPGSPPFPSPLQTAHPAYPALPSGHCTANNGLLSSLLIKYWCPEFTCPGFSKCWLYKTFNILYKSLKEPSFPHSCAKKVQMVAQKNSSEDSFFPRNSW